MAVGSEAIGPYATADDTSLWVLNLLVARILIPVNARGRRKRRIEVVTCPRISPLQHQEMRPD